MLISVAAGISLSKLVFGVCAHMRASQAGFAVLNLFFWNAATAGALVNLGGCKVLQRCRHT